MKSFKNRRELALFLNEMKAEVAVEIGVRDGDYSEYILENTNISKLYSVDPWEANQELSTPQASFDNCNHKLRRFGERSVIVKSESLNFVDKIEDGVVDFIYIDALHDYKSV